MTREVVTVGAEDLLTDVARRMSELGVSGFPVVWPDGRVAGVISEGDLLKRWRALHIPTFVSILGGMFPVGSLTELEREIREIAAVKVAEIMSRPAVTARPDWTLGQAAQAMMSHQVNRLPVIDEAGRLVGILTRADLIRTLAGAGKGGTDHGGFPEPIRE